MLHFEDKETKQKVEKFITEQKEKSFKDGHLNGYTEGCAECKRRIDKQGFIPKSELEKIIKWVNKQEGQPIHYLDIKAKLIKLTK